MIGTRESRLVQYHAVELVGLGWDQSSALAAARSLVYGDEADAPGIDPAVRKRWSYYKSKLATHGHRAAGGPERIAIPKSSLSDEHVRDLGFHDAGNAAADGNPKGALGTLTHHEHNLRLHDHGEFWLLHEDRHPNLSKALRSTRDVVEKKDAIKDALAHVFGKGSPGLGAYLLARVRDNKSKAEALAEAKRAARRKKK